MDRRAEERDDYTIRNRLTKFGSEILKPIIKQWIGCKRLLIHLDFERVIKLRDFVKKLAVWAVV